MAPRIRPANPTQQTTRCVIYARVSSREQEEGFSIPAQLELLRAYATRHGLIIMEEYVEAVSAKMGGHRPKFQAMINSLKHPAGPRILLVEKTDRLQRNLRDYVAIDELVDQHQVTVHLVKEGEVVTSSSSSSSKLMFAIKSVIAKNYLDNLRDEVMKGIMQRVQKGFWKGGHAPYGYESRQGNLVINDTEAAYLRYLFGLAATGLYSCDSLRAAMEQEGWVYKPSNPVPSRSKVHYLLTNPVYIGVVLFRGVEYPGIHEPIIDSKTWARVQTALKKGNKPVKRVQQTIRYAGLLTCGECGAQVSGDKKKGGAYTYYQCAQARGNKNYRTCTQPAVEQRVIDAEIDAIISSIQVADHLLTQLPATIAQLLSAKEREDKHQTSHLTRSLTQAKNALNKGLREFLEGNIDQDQWRLIKTDYEARITTLEAEIAHTSHGDETWTKSLEMAFELPKILSSGWSQLDDANKQSLAAMLFSNCTLKDRNIVLKPIPLLAVFKNFQKIKLVEPEGQFSNYLGEVKPILTPAAVQVLRDILKLTMSA